MLSVASRFQVGRSQTALVRGFQSRTIGVEVMRLILTIDTFKVMQAGSGVFGPPMTRLRLGDLGQGA